MSFRTGLAGLVLLTLGSLALACWAQPPSLTSDPSSEVESEALSDQTATTLPPAGAEPEVGLPLEPLVAVGNEAQLGAARTAASNAVRRGLPYLEREGIAWFEGRVRFQDGDGCVSCHVVGWTLWSHREADFAGLGSNSSKLTDLGERATEFLLRPRKGRAVTWSQAILGRAVNGVTSIAAGAAAGEITEGDAITAATGSALAPSGSGALLQMADLIAASQEGDGFWRARGQYPSQRRPIREGDAAATMWTLVSLSTLSDLNTEVAESRDRALAWLETEEGETSEWVAARLVVAHESESPDRVDVLLARLLGDQRADGGWGWLPGEESNAFSTGQGLYALARTGLGLEHAAVERAVSFLVDSQREDGAWAVPGELISKEGGEAKDYVYDFWGTAWATIGLSRVLGPGEDDAQG